MANVNKVFLIGNLTRNPEVRYTPKGTAVAEIGLAVNRRRTGDNGEPIEEVTFVDVTAWGRTAENVGKYLEKGRPVHVEGRLALDQWEDKETGQKRSRLKVVAEAIQFLGGGDRSQSQSPPHSQSQSAPPPGPDNLGDEPDDDIPF